jgi:hypothetical protein
MTSAVSLTIVSPELVDEAGETDLRPGTWSGELKSNAGCSDRGELSMTSRSYARACDGWEPGPRPGTWSGELKSNVGSDDRGGLSMVAGWCGRGCDGCVADAPSSMGSGK